MKQKQVTELLLQSLQHEKGGIKVYETAIRCAINEDLNEEWQKYLEETQEHVRILTEACEALDIDPNASSPGCKVVEHVGTALVEAMEMALAEGDANAAQLVACECVVLAETKDHADWELLTKCADKATGAQRKVLQAAVDEVEDEEDEHLYHTKGWCRELWLESLGLKAVLPPPEEEKDVKTAIGAARAEKASARAR